MVALENERVTKRRAAKKPSPTRRSAKYTTKIIKAGALVGDAKMLLAHWDTAASVRDNLDRLRRENLFGKASRSRVEDILAIFRQRYLTEPDVTIALVALVRNGLSAEALDRVLFFHAAIADLLLHDVVTEVLAPLHAQGRAEVTITDIQVPLAQWIKEGRTTSRWSSPTLLRVVQGLLATLRDFGVLQGAVNKRFAPTYMPVEAFAYVAFFLKHRQASGAKLIDAQDWKLFFLSHDGVERFLFEAHQKGLLEYHAAGTVIRITFPTESLEEYANALTQRAY